MGRKKQFPEQIRLPLEAGAIARIDASLADGETRLDMIRDAIKRELERRAGRASQVSVEFSEHLSCK